jgi:hypothetical protein
MGGGRRVNSHTNILNYSEPHEGGDFLGDIQTIKMFTKQKGEKVIVLPLFIAIYQLC